MPIQNIGTLIENLVVVEAAGLLLRRVGDRSLGFATAFAMPPLSEWRPHSKAVGISDRALRQIRDSRDGSEFLKLLRLCLNRFPDQGPIGALLVALLARLRGSGLYLWANDIEAGHYGNAIPALGSIEALVREILPDCKVALTVEVCKDAYPDSLRDLRAACDRWKENVGAFWDSWTRCATPANRRPALYQH
jgi:hypothetical protein